MASVALRLPIVLAVGLASQGAVAVAPPVRLLLTSDWQPHFRTSEIFVASAANGRTISLTRNEVDDVDPAWSPEGSTIAFASKRDGNWELYTMRPDGSGVRRLTHTAANEREPAWSPDGKQLAFVSDGARNEKGGPIDAIFVMNRDGSGGHRITSPDEGDAAEPAWSPDGTRIAAVEEAAELSRIFTIASDGSDRRYVGPYGAGEPAWSPGGGQLAYTRFRDELNTSDAWVMDVDGTRGRRIATDASTPTWSPDGASIAVVRLPRIVITKDGVYPAGGLTVGVVREDGRGIRNVFARAPRADQSVSESLQWSPDGTKYFGLTWATDGNRLVFGRRTEGRPRDVFSIRPDGSSLRNLTRTPRLFESSPLPSPDGRYVTFARDAISVGRALWLMRSDGTHPRKIAGGATRASWSPDGRRFAFARWTHGAGSPTAIWMATARSGRPRRLAEGESPSWSPDGRTIAFVRTDARGRYPSSSILLMTVGGTAVRSLAFLAQKRAYDLSWGPDGKRIAFVADHSRGGSIVSWVGVVEVASGGVRYLTRTHAHDTDVSWSPSGGWIAFSRSRPNVNRRETMLVIRPDGTHLHSPTRSDADSEPSWSPDGRRLVFRRLVHGQLELFTVAPDGRDLRRLTHNLADEAEAAWMR
jgi:Tol biopolymer transport system component